MVPRENKSNAYAKFWKDKQRVLWYFWKWPIIATVGCLVAKTLNGSEAEGNQFPFVQKCNSVFQQIFHHLLEKSHSILVSYLVDRDLSNGQCSAPFDQLGPVKI